MEGFPIKDICGTIGINHNPIYVLVMVMKVNHHQVVFMGDYTINTPLEKLIVKMGDFSSLGWVLTTCITYRAQFFQDEMHSPPSAKSSAIVFTVCSAALRLRSSYMLRSLLVGGVLSGVSRNGDLRSPISLPLYCSYFLRQLFWINFSIS